MKIRFWHFVLFLGILWLSLAIRKSIGGEGDFNTYLIAMLNFAWASAEYKAHIRLS